MGPAFSLLEWEYKQGERGQNDPCGNRLQTLMNLCLI